ncbi:MAG: tRNA-dihydrouridine synthase, partial [Gammaproteobacteria bacterium]|nr:tRNA-dihydrouridine synthase [Gammaproteobacteria bacterium]
RTRACGYSGEAEYDTIAAVKRAVSIPVIANGDIDSAEKAAEVLHATGADGVMIGRAAQGRPWIFREIAHYLATGTLLPAPGLDRVRDLLLEHTEALYDLYGRAHGVRIARKHIGWYCRNRPGSAEFRRHVNGIEDAEGQRSAIRAFFNAGQETTGSQGTAPPKEAQAA